MRKQLYLEGKRQRAIGYDFSPLMGDPFEGFGEEGVLVGKTLGIFNPEKIPSADQTNETILSKAAIRNAPIRRRIRHQFSHPMLNHAVNSPMGVDSVNHVMEQNGPVATEIKELVEKMRIANYDSETLSKLAQDINARRTPLGISFRDGAYYDLMGKVIPGLVDQVEYERLQADRSIDYAAVKAKIGNATSFNVATQMSFMIQPSSIRLNYLQAIADEIVAANKTAESDIQGKEYYEKAAISTGMGYAQLADNVRSKIPSLILQLNPSFANQLIASTYAYQQKMRYKEQYSLVQTYIERGYKSTAELPAIATMFGNRTLEQIYPGINDLFTSTLNAKNAKDIDDKAKEAINKDIWTAAEYYASFGGIIAALGTSSSPQAIETRAKLQERIDWYKDNGKQGKIKKYRDRLQWLISNTEEGRAIAAEDSRIAKERDAEGGFFSTLLKIVGPLAAIVLPFAAPALLTSLPVVGGVSSAVTTAVASVPMISKVADVVTTVKAAIPTEVIDNAKTMYNAGTSVINTVYPEKPPTTTSVLPAPPVAPLQTVAPAPVPKPIAATPIKTPVRYYEHPMLTYGLIKRKA